MGLPQPEPSLVGPDGTLLNRPIMRLEPVEAQYLRAAAIALRKRRYRMTVRCDVCFEEFSWPDGTRGEISPTQIHLECRCRFLQFEGSTP